MTEQQIQISKDSELMAQVISLIASYAIENDMSPNETIKTVAEDMLVLLEIATFDNWEKKTLPPVISTSDDCVSREQAKIDVIPNTYYTSEQVIALLDNLSPVTLTIPNCEDCIEKLKKIEQIVKQVESLHPEIAIGDREGIRKIKEVLNG